MPHKKPKLFTAIISFFFLCVFSNCCIAQKCNYERNEIDGLTELMVKRTTPRMLARINGQPLYVKAQSIGLNKYLKLVFYKYNDFSFQEQREVGFILSNDEELLLYPRVMPVDSTKNEMVNIKSLLVYKLTNEQYLLLKQYPVAKFKYYITTGFVEATIKSSKQGAVMQVMSCIE